MAEPRVYNAFGGIGKHVPPSALVRRWDEVLIAALGAAVVVGAVVAVPMGYAGVPIGTDLLLGGWSALGDADAWARLREGWGVLCDGLVLVPSAVAGALAGRVAARPRSNRVHVSGTRLLEGAEALAAARARAGDPVEPFALRIHPEYTMAKRRWGQHVLVLGGVGAGKTVIMGGWLDQIIRGVGLPGGGASARPGFGGLKCLIYDVKGDLTSRYLEPVIISPYDARSWVWLIGQDVLSAADADILAEQLLPPRPGESNPFFTNGGQMIISALVRMLQVTKGTAWRWQELREALQLSAEAKLEVLKTYHPMASVVLNDPQAKSANDLMATVAIASRAVDDLAKAWPPEQAERNGRSRTFSIRRWIRDDYTGRKQVIVQGGGSPSLTAAYIGAMVNIAASAICSGALPDNEGGRFLGFFLDEVTTCGRLDLRLWTLGRSKGVVVCAATQSPELLARTYSREEADTVMTVSATTIYGRMGAGSTRDKVAEHAGRNRVAALRPDQAFEESDNILRTYDLTNKLGFKKTPDGAAVTAILDQGGDLLMLDWPVVSYPKKREEQVPGVLMLPPPRSDPDEDVVPLEQEQAVAVLEVLDRLRALGSALPAFEESALTD